MSSKEEGSKRREEEEEYLAMVGMTAEWMEVYEEAEKKDKGTNE